MRAVLRVIVWISFLVLTIVVIVARFSNPDMTSIRFALTYPLFSGVAIALLILALVAWSDQETQT